MDQHRWQRIERLYHSALEHPPSKRRAFVAGECKDDDALRCEVESLLGKDAAPGEELIDRPAWEGAGGLLRTKAETQLTAGTQLGPYRIEQLIGSGGMGRVYRARDIRLGRAVAIKVTAKEFTGRFEREARAIGALGHAHICTLFDVGPNYLVMELVEGESLADRIGKGALRFDDVIRYGSEIADALDTAHGLGVVHRDLKPGNVMITSSGAKVLDFGLAKIQAPGETLTLSHAVMGTPAYMAPEQREGRECDGRTDIFALGLLLYEAATGKRLGPGQSPSREGLPPQFLHVVERCMAEEPAERWQSASDVRRELLWAAESARTRVAEVGGRKTTKARRAGIAAALLTLGIVLGFALGRPWRRAGNGRAVHLSVTAPAGTELTQGSAISPDGEQLVFVARAGGAEKLWLRRLSSPTARELTGTEGAAFPFWSPDSGSVGFFADGKLKRIDVASGLTSAICDVGRGRGGTWSADGTILFNSVNDGPLLRVAASGGESAAVTTLDAARRENSHRWPYFLPGGRRFLYLARTDDHATQGIYVGSLDDPKEKTLLVRSLGNGIYAPSEDGKDGYLLWVRDAILMAQPMDPRSARLSGRPVALAERVGIAEGYQYAEISASKDSGIVYRSASQSLFQMTWYTRQGQPTGSIGEPDAFTDLRISPEGSRILMRRAVYSQNSGYTMMELSRRMVPVRLVSSAGMAWSPDGLRIAYGRSAPPNVYLKRLDGSAPEERLVPSTSTQVVTDWSLDGRFLLYTEDSNEVGAKTRSDIWAFSLEEHKAIPITSTRYREMRARFSPNGKWIAYSSDELGRVEIFVESFPPQPGSRWQVSRKGGDHPRWRGDEFFYVAPDGTLMSVKVDISGKMPVFGAPVPLFKIAIPAQMGTSDTPYDVATDGRVLAMAHAGEPVVPSLTVALGWDAQLRAGQR